MDSKNSNLQAEEDCVEQGSQESAQDYRIRLLKIRMWQILASSDPVSPSQLAETAEHVGACLASETEPRIVKLLDRARYLLLLSSANVTGFNTGCLVR